MTAEDKLSVDELTVDEVNVEDPSKAEEVSVDEPLVEERLPSTVDEATTPELLIGEEEVGEFVSEDNDELLGDETSVVFSEEAPASLAEDGLSSQAIRAKRLKNANNFILNSIING